MNLIAAQSLLKAANDLAPSHSAIDSGSVVGELVGVEWLWVVVAVRGASVELWAHGWNEKPIRCLYSATLHSAVHSNNPTMERCHEHIS